MPLACRLLAYAVALVVAACGRPDGAGTAAGPAAVADAASAPVLLLASEDLHTIGAGGAGAGPVITGSIQPEQRADLRAEVAAVVMQVLRDNGEPVRRGELLVRLDDTAIRESLQSAEAGARAAQQAFDQAQRQADRLRTLQAQGMSSVQALDDAEGRRNAAQSELVAARARVVSAQQQLRRTEVRAPFDGVVSDRKASVGDTAQIGKELLKVIDPRTMRLEGLVAAERMDDIGAGRRVVFRIHGVEGVEYSGRIRRVDASANPVTRQVGVLVSFDDPARAPRVAGLYAEGRVEGSGDAVVRLPESAVVRSGGAAHVWRVSRDGTLSRVAVQLGERDPRSGTYELRSGLGEGDVVLRHPGNAPVDGQRAEFAANAVRPASAAR